MISSGKWKRYEFSLGFAYLCAARIGRKHSKRPRAPQPRRAISIEPPRGRRAAGLTICIHYIYVFLVSRRFERDSIAGWAAFWYLGITLKAPRLDWVPPRTHTRAAPPPSSDQYPDGGDKSPHRAQLAKWKILLNVFRILRFLFDVFTYTAHQPDAQCAHSLVAANLSSRTHCMHVNFFVCINSCPMVGGALCVHCDERGWTGYLLLTAPIRRSCSDGFGSKWKLQKNKLPPRNAYTYIHARACTQ